MTAEPIAVPAAPARDERGRARRGVVTYLGVLGAMSAATMTAYGLTGQRAFGAIALVSPAVASVIARALGWEGFSDVSWRVGRLRPARACGIAVLIPLIIASVTYGIAWATGLADFDPLAADSPLGGDPITVGSSADLSFLAQVGIAVTIGTISLSLVAIGEEIGWRGYLLTRLVRAGVRRPVLVHAGLWALWHLPFTFLVGYAAGTNAALAAPVLVAQITAAGYLLAHLRLTTGSIWPAVLFHGAWNATIQLAFDPATTGSGHAPWVGESGLLTTLAVIAVAVAVTSRPWPVHDHPGDRSPVLLFER